MTDESLDSRLSRLRIEKHRKVQRRRRWPWILLVLALAGLAGGVVYWKANAPVTVKVARLEAVRFEPGQGMPIVTASGYVIPRRKVDVSSKIIGRVKEVKIKRGDRVAQGDLLVTMEDEDYQARVRAAKAQVEVLQARVSELRNGSRPQEIAAADATAAAAAATLKNAAQELQRVEALAKKGFAAAQELERAKAAHDVAKANLDAARKSADLVKIGPRAEQIAAAEAQLQEAGASLELAETELGYTVVRAPIAGTILEKIAEQGELATNMNFGGTRGAKTALVTMADLSDLQVEVDLNETDLAKVKIGQKTEIRLDANPTGVYAGAVDEIAPQADRQKGTVQTKIRFLQPDAHVVTELNARVTFLGDAPPADAAATSQLWAPLNAVLRDGERASVFVVRDGVAHLQTVVLGEESERGIEVKQGISSGDEIIVGPPEKLSDGARVTPAPQ